MTEEKIDTCLTPHLFQETLQETPVTFYVMKMNKCLFVWIGDSGNFDSLSVAMKTPFASYPTSCSLMGHAMDDESSSIATKLSSKTGKQVFVSYNISKNDNKMMLYIIERILEEYSLHPEKILGINQNVYH